MNINGCNQLKDVYTRFLTLPFQNTKTKVRHENMDKVRIIV